MVAVPAARIQARKLIVAGRVQGVGFRPFVYRSAQQLGLAGQVHNSAGQVVIHIQGPAPALEIFERALIHSAPPLAQPKLLSSRAVGIEAADGFRISASHADARPDIHVPPDYFTCDDCLAEMQDPAARRYRYPFINCTQCGPRYTLIESLPYDRPNTAMRGFPLCRPCDDEYRNPLDRRFHAQPLACADCGPSLSWRCGSEAIDGNEAALAAVVEALHNGAILAVKGVGGYHLMCRADDGQAVARLRQRKGRPHKPLAVMFPMTGADGLSGLRQQLHPNAEESQWLRDPRRPIVLVRKRPDCSLAEGIAPGLNEIGAFLPYSPLHHLLLGDLGSALVATSGNRSGEPVLTDPIEAERRLADIADAFLHHDRPILRPADDSVYRHILGQVRPLRLGRGVAPVEHELAQPVPEPVLAVGGHMKATIALAWDRRVVVSPHISDLDSPRGQALFRQLIEDFQGLYGIKARHLICDAHPGYASTRWARSRGLPLTPVLHHHAHASAIAGEHPEINQWLVFAWDGTGYGADGTLWGGEVLLGRPGHWQRVASLRPFRLPGGERAGREPWRSAAALCWEAGIDYRPAIDGHEMARAAWQHQMNTPTTSAAGRLFDGLAALVTGTLAVSYEGQAPMQLEALAGNLDAEAIELPWSADDRGLPRLDWAPLLALARQNKQAAAQRAAAIHESLAAAMAALVGRLGEQHRIEAVGLTGGVFQNRRLSEAVAARLDPGLALHLPAALPANDGGLSYGQIIDYAGRQPAQENP